MRRILDARALGEHARQLLQCRRRRLEGVEELRDLLHRFEEHPQIQQERGKGADRHLPVQHPVAAVEQHHAGGEVADQLDPRHEDGQQFHRLLVDVAVPVGESLEDLLVAGFPPVSLDGLDARHRLDELHDHQGGALADLAVRLRGLAAEPPHQTDEYRERGQTHQPEPHVEHDKQNRGADECEHRGDQAVEAGLQHLLDRVDVVGGPAHHPARRVALVERDVEPLEVTEHPAPQFE